MDTSAQKVFDRADIVRDVRLRRCIRQVDATPSEVKLFCKGGAVMRSGMRFGLSASEKRDVWIRWKAGQTLARHRCE